MDWDGFHVCAKAVVPSDYLWHPDQHWIAVLKHELSPEANFLEESDFIWMEGHERVKIKQIAKAYRDEYPNVKFELRHRDTVLEDHTRIKTLINYSDNLTVLRAVAHVTRLPLQRVNAQMTVEPSQSKDSAKSPIQRHPSGTPTRGKTASHIENQSTYIAESLGRPDREMSRRDWEPALSQNKLSHLDNSTNDQSPFTADQPTIISLSASPPPCATSAYVSPPTLARSGRGDSNKLGYAKPSFPGVSSACPGQANLQAHPYQPTPTASTIPIVQMLPTPVDAPAMRIQAEAELNVEATPEMDPVQPIDSQASNSFDPDDISAKDFEPTAELDPEAKFTNQHIQNINRQTNPEILEAGVAQAMGLLKPLERAFARFANSSEDASARVQLIDKLRQQALCKRTVIGVVGNTGAGKSSVINAILDEERLVPTNCMRACTSAVTELSWNDSKDANSRYRAEIEFITPEEWEKDLEFLLNEFLLDTGVVAREAADQNSDAGVAWAKFHAVYPKKTKDMVKDCDIPTLMKEVASHDVLGTTKKVQKSNPEYFYKHLQKYVDSKEKSTGKDKGMASKKKVKSPIEHWPLIKKVRIYVKSRALSTGAVIVDLPGVQDSNPARAAVAQNYMKQCTDLWIVAPITRAVNDKTAQKLMGDSFKRQLKMDGGLSSVTFICSKTDDISMTEAIDSLSLQDDMAALNEQLELNEKAIEDLTTEISDLEKSKSMYDEVVENAEKELDIWTALKADFDDGNIVYAPRQNRKRKRSKPKARSKKRRHKDDGTDDESFSSSSDTDDESKVEIAGTRERLTGDDIKSKIGEIKASKKIARGECTALRRRIKMSKKEIASLEGNNNVLRAKKGAACISGRNEYSKGAIQQGFAAGIKELDQELALEADEGNFDPDKELRDYDQMARDLPVFCVSTRAYQKMCGRMQKDNTVPGFLKPEETEVPQLQAHCMKLTEGVRVRTSSAFLEAFQQLLNTLYLWACNDVNDMKLTNVEKRHEFKHLENRLGELEKELGKEVGTCIKEIQQDITCRITKNFPKLTEEAVAAAPHIVELWGAKKAKGGLPWSTYKAVVRCEGVYQSPTAGLRDFNADLTEPIIKKIATGWEETFQQKLPKAFESYTKTIRSILRRFHDKTEREAHGISLVNMQLLANNAIAHERLLEELRGQLIEVVTKYQRDANRLFTTRIKAEMLTVYKKCKTQSGPGCWGRMKDHMRSYVDLQRHHMFTAATEVVREHLDGMCRTIKDLLEAKANDIFMHIKVDYKQALGDIDTRAEDTKMPEAEQDLRIEIKRLLLRVDEQFKDISEGKIAPPPDEDDRGTTKPDAEEDAIDVDAVETGEDDDENDKSEDIQVLSDTEMQDSKDCHSRDVSHAL